MLWLLEPETTTETAIDTGSVITEPSTLVESQATEVLTGANFVDWRDSLECRCLLVTASPGSGKSVLSNFVTGHLEERTTGSKSEKVIYYFCNIRVPLSERTAEAVVRALIIQLCQDQDSLIRLLPPRFEKDSNAFLKAPLGELWGIFGSMMQRSPLSHMYCVIDGLDVYGSCMVELVHKLLAIFGTSELELPMSRKLLCTSRPEPGIMKSWGGNLERQLRPNGSDLRKYVDSRLANLEDFNYSMREAARAMIVKDFENPRLSYQVGSTFLLISIAIRKLEQMSFPTVAKIRAEIKDSSRNLDDLFEDMIVAVSERTPANAVILAWVVYAEQPLTLDQLQEATAVEPSRVYETYDQLDETRPQLTEPSVRRELGVLLDIVEGRVFVIHQSVQDFVKRTKLLERWVSPAPRTFVGECCMRYLILCLAESQGCVETSGKVSLDLNDREDSCEV